MLAHPNTGAMPTPTSDAMSTPGATTQQYMLCPHQELLHSSTCYVHTRSYYTAVHAMSTPGATTQQYMLCPHQELLHSSTCYVHTRSYYTAVHAMSTPGATTQQYMLCPHQELLHSSTCYHDIVDYVHSATIETYLVPHLNHLPSLPVH